MDIEYHYYINYLVAAKAGFPPKDAEIIAYASQYVDENHKIYQINVGQSTAYANYITQTLNILKPKDELMRIYPIFHFIPGDPLAPTARRKDGKLHLLNTTPNSRNANLIMDEAIASDNLYRIGIASHSYVDTWAHQNFVGYYDVFNAMKGVLSSALPNIGHADAKHSPDWPALIWHDCRLVTSNAQVDNKQRFLDATRHLFYKYRRCVDSSVSSQCLEHDADQLICDLDQAIGDYDTTNHRQGDRIQNYLGLSEKRSYGHQQLPKFDSRDWFDQAITQSVRGIDDRKAGIIPRFASFRDRYFWKENHTQSHWYQFQEAAKIHQTASWSILVETTFHHLELENF
ncbi:MAG: DUF6765 family protein [Elainellaceae cyanobacterium]